jgi:hypothetical protein
VHNDIIILAACLAGAGIAVATGVLVHAFSMPHERGSLAAVGLRFMRWFLAALLAASGIWIIAAPRADQPLLDAAERAFPAIRFAYMDERSPDSQETAALRRERANARERNRWWIGAVLLALGLSLVISLPSRRTTPRNSGGERGSTPP